MAAARVAAKINVKLSMVVLPLCAYVSVSDPDDGYESKQLHTECFTPHKQKLWCVACDKEIQRSDLIKGIDIGGGNWVTISTEERDTIRADSSHTVDIERIVDAATIDPIFYEKTYYLTAQDTAGETPYAALRESWRGKMAIGVWTHHYHDHQVGIRVSGQLLVLHVLVDGALIRNPAESIGDKLLCGANVKVDKRMQDLSNSITASYAGVFDPTNYVESYREKEHKLIEQKIAGVEITKPASVDETPKPVQDFMAMLTASIEQGTPAKALVTRKITKLELVKAPKPVKAAKAKKEKQVA